MLLKGHCLYSFIQKVIEMTDFLLLNARTGIIDCYYKNTFYNNRMNDFICLDANGNIQQYANLNK